MNFYRPVNVCLAAVLLSGAILSAAPPRWAVRGDLEGAREGACSVALADNRMLVIGGRTDDGASARVDVLAGRGGFVRH